MNLSWADGQLVKATISGLNNRKLPPIRLAGKLVDVSNDARIEIRPN